MDQERARIQMLSRLFTVSLAVFFVNFIVVWIYVWLWALFTDWGEAVSDWVHLVLWVILPILVSFVTLKVGRWVDWNNPDSTPFSRKAFNLLSAILFLEMIGVSLLSPTSVTYVMSISAALLSIYLFRLWKPISNSEQVVE